LPREAEVAENLRKDDHQGEVGVLQALDRAGANKRADKQRGGGPELARPVGGTLRKTVPTMAKRNGGGNAPAAPKEEQARAGIEPASCAQSQAQRQRPNLAARRLRSGERA
jgi:hypothetical protein